MKGKVGNKDTTNIPKLNDGKGYSKQRETTIRDTRDEETKNIRRGTGEKQEEDEQILKIEKGKENHDEA